MKNRNKLIVTVVAIVFIVLLIFLVPEIFRRIALSECNKQEVEISDRVVKKVVKETGGAPSSELLVKEINNRVALCMKRKGF